MEPRVVEFVFDLGAEIASLLEVLDCFESLLVVRVWFFRPGRVRFSLDHSGDLLDSLVVSVVGLVHCSL